jgi:hypothetical protein
MICPPIDIIQSRVAISFVRKPSLGIINKMA